MSGSEAKWPSLVAACGVLFLAFEVACKLRALLEASFP
jgi:hypothetical protein